MANSFLNEHSAEFVIVPAFSAILATEFETVIPLQFWLGREGSLLSRQSLVAQQVLVVALFARRPKIDRLSQSYIEVKFNERLFRLAAFMEGYHIPVFAGVPLTSSLDHFHLRTSCAWFWLPGSGQEEIVRVSLDDAPSAMPRFALPVKGDGILTGIAAICRPLTWTAAISVFQDARRGFVPGYSQHLFYGDIYKPVYFVLPLLPRSPFFQNNKN